MGFDVTPALMGGCNIRRGPMKASLSWKLRQCTTPFDKFFLMDFFLIEFSFCLENENRKKEERKKKRKK